MGFHGNYRHADYHSWFLSHYGILNVQFLDPADGISENARFIGNAFNGLAMRHRFHLFPLPNRFSVNHSLGHKARPLNGEFNYSFAFGL
jgi:hypothetical protein